MYIFWGLEVSIPGFFGVGKFIYLFIYFYLPVLGTVTATALHRSVTVPSPMKDRPLHQGLRQLFLWVASLSGEF